MPETVIGNDVTGWDFPSAFKAVSSSRLQPATKIYRAAVSVAGRAAPARPVLIPTSETRSWVCETHGWTGIDANFCSKTCCTSLGEMSYSGGVPTSGTVLSVL